METPALIPRPERTLTADEADVLQLAGTGGVRVAGQDLFDERGARARHADDEDRAFAVGADARLVAEQFGREDRHRAFGEALLLVGVVEKFAVDEVVGPAQVAKGIVELAHSVEDSGQGEAQPRLHPGSQAVVADEVLHPPHLLVGEAVAAVIGQKLVDPRRFGVEGAQPINHLQRLFERALLLQQGDDLLIGAGEPRMGVAHVFKDLHRLDVAVLLDQDGGQVDPNCLIVRAQRNGAPVVGLGIGEAVPLLQQVTQVVVRLAVAGVAVDGGAIVGQGLFRAFLGVEGAGQPVMGGAIAGSDLERLLERQSGLVRGAAFQQGAAQVAARQRIGGRRRHRLAEVAQRRLAFAQLRQRGAQVHVGAGVVGRVAQGLAESRRGGRKIALFEKRQADVVMGVGVARLERDGAAEAGQSVVAAAAGHQRHAQVGVEPGVSVVEADGTGDQLGGRHRVASVKRHQAEQVECVGVVGMVLEGLAA